MVKFLVIIFLISLPLVYFPALTSGRDRVPAMGYFTLPTLQGRNEITRFKYSRAAKRAAATQEWESPAATAVSNLFFPLLLGYI
jgi:hypothetical protein